MTNPLEILKAQLEKALNETTETEDFKEALRDGVYATSLSVSGLESWINLWSDSQDSNYLYGAEFSKEYQQGVQFVEEKWYQITGMF